MTIKDEIAEYLKSQPGPKQEDLRVLHQIILKLKPRIKLWYLDGRNRSRIRNFFQKPMEKALVRQA